MNWHLILGWIVAFIVGRIVWDYIKLRWKHPFSWECPACPQEGRRFRFSSNNVMATNTVAVQHMHDFHTTLSEQGER